MSQGVMPPPEHPVLAAVRAMAGRAKDAVQGSAWSMSDAEVCAGLVELAGLQAVLAAVEVALVAEADARNLGVAQATSTAGWLRSTLRIGPAAARHVVGLARAVGADYAATGVALAGGQVNAEQARTIVGVLGGLPAVDRPTRAAAEDFLIDQAAVLDPVGLGLAGRHLCQTLTTDPDPEGRARRQHERRSLHLVPAYDGMTMLRGLLDVESAAVLSAALDPLAAPRPADVDGVPDQRTAAQRRADALIDLARVALASGDLPATGGVKPTLVVTIDHATLAGQLTGAGRLPGGEVLSPSAARRVGCDARIIPVLLGGRSQPLDVGRSRRTVPEPLRAALTVRDTGCAFPGCDRPPGWCDAHHIRHWSHGGQTALHNLVLLCGQHHRAVHDHHWAVALDEHALPYVRPPAWIDADHSPRQHHRYSLRRLGPHAGAPDPPRRE